MQNATGLSILTVAQLMAADRPPRAALLPPWLASDTAALVYGPPGIGKSFLTLGIAWAVASGGSFLGGRAPRSNRVVYLDSEMAAVDLRDRLRALGPIPESLEFIMADLGKDSLPGLATDEAQAAYAKAFDPTGPRSRPN
jgi:putative DNA primase/helicase